MPLKSKAQVRKYAELKLKGEITETQFKEAVRSTDFKNLPERVTQKAKAPTKVGKVKTTKTIK